MSRTYRVSKYNYMALSLSLFSFLKDNSTRKKDLKKGKYRIERNSKNRTKKEFKRLWNKEERQFYRNEIYKNISNLDYELQVFKHSKLTDIWDFD